MYKASWTQNEHTWSQTDKLRIFHKAERDCQDARGSSDKRGTTECTQTMRRSRDEVKSNKRDKNADGFCFRHARWMWMEIRVWFNHFADDDAMPMLFALYIVVFVTYLVAQAIRKIPSLSSFYVQSAIVVAFHSQTKMRDEKTLPEFFASALSCRNLCT